MKSIPSPSGNPKSRMMRSGLRVPASVNPCRKVSVSTTLHPSASKAVRTKRRICRSSSTSIATGDGSTIGGLGFHFHGRGGRGAERQHEGERDAATGLVGADDGAVVGFDDGPADRQTQSHSRGCRFAVTAREFLKQRLL